MSYQGVVLNAYLDEMVKISERKPLTKGDLKRFGKGLAITGLGAGAGAGAGTLASWVVRRAGSRLSPAQQASLGRKLGVGGAVVGALLGMTGAQLNKELRRYIERR
jgi:hypothetical protein